MLIDISCQIVTGTKHSYAVSAARINLYFWATLFTNEKWVPGKVHLETPEFWLQIQFGPLMNPRRKRK